MGVRNFSVRIVQAKRHKLSPFQRKKNLIFPEKKWDCCGVPEWRSYGRQLLGSDPGAFELYRQRRDSEIARPDPCPSVRLLALYRSLRRLEKYYYPHRR